VVISPGQVREVPVYGPYGIRPKGGASPVQAQARNLGTCRLDVKGDTQGEAPQGFEYRCEAQGRNDP